MPVKMDELARKYLELQKRRAKGEIYYGPRDPVNGPKDANAAERHNWNVTAADMAEIEEALKSDEPFADKALETKESSLEQINDAVRRMKRGDVSKYNHVPQFLREYYGRKALTAVFGSARSFPPMTEELKTRLNEMTVRPEFRDALARLIDRGAVDSSGNSLVPRLREYDTYLNERLLSDMLKPVSAEDAERIRQKFPGEKGEKMLANNRERQAFIAKTLFMTQLGRMDLIEDTGVRRPYTGSVAELFSHGSRVGFSLPPGEKKAQDMVYDAWQKNVLDSGAMFKGRFASHEMHRRLVDPKGNVAEHFEEKRIKWAYQLKHGQINKKITTYKGNYGMNVSLGGMGRPFNGTDCIDDQGGFGHVYVRTRKGDAEHCGSILLGFENAQPKKESCIGQLHNFKALSHDLSSFYSSKATVGKLIGGREADLSNLSPDDLSQALNQFELGFRTLRQRAQTDPEAARQLEALNQKLCGPRMTAPELANLLTSLGMEKSNAIRCVSYGRSPRNAGYAPKGPAYLNRMYQVKEKDVQDPPENMPNAAKAAQKRPSREQGPGAGDDKYRAYIHKHMKIGEKPTKASLADKVTKVAAARFMKNTKRKFDAAQIDRIAKHIRSSYAVDLLEEKELKAALQSDELALKSCLNRRDQLYRVTAGSEIAYSQIMKRTLRNMVDPKGHSTAYQKLYQSVKAAAELESSLVWKSPEQRSLAVMNANINIMEAVDAYTQGKEAPRKTLKGVNTFDSALDAAACIQRFAPGVKARTEALLERINEARKPEDRLNPEDFSKDYGRSSVNRNKINSWEELASVKSARAEPKQKAAPAAPGL